jgi:hypothetical protein
MAMARAMRELVQDALDPAIATGCKTSKSSTRQQLPASPPSIQTASNSTMQQWQEQELVQRHSIRSILQLHQDAKSRKSSTKCHSCPLARQRYEQIASPPCNSSSYSSVGLTSLSSLISTLTTRAIGEDELELIFRLVFCKNRGVVVNR